MTLSYPAMFRRGQSTRTGSVTSRKGMTHDVKKGADTNTYGWGLFRRWSSRGRFASLSLTKRLDQIDEEKKQEQGTEKEEKGDKEVEERERSHKDDEGGDEEEDGDGLATLISLRRSRRAMTGDVIQAVEQHRGSVIQHQLSLPDDHPFTNTQDTPRDTSELLVPGRDERSESIEIRRTDSPLYTVLFSLDIPVSRSATPVNRRPRFFTH